jgi:hypothetical protein
MQIDITYDSSVNSAPSAFKTDIGIAVQYLESEFTNPVTISIDVGYGEIDGRSLQSDDLGESEWAQDVPESYTTVRNTLIAEGAPGASTLPISSPNQGTLYISPAEAKALGLSVNDGGIDGYVGFSSAPNTFSYADGAAPPSNEFYFIGSVEHEITEDMGRVSLINRSDQYSVTDLFRYSSPGVRDLTIGESGSTAYFSINNGTTNLGSWNDDPSNGDLADWYGSNIPNGGDDAFDDYSPAGVVNAFSSSDVTLMEALGWTGPAPTWTKIDGGTPTAMAGGDFEGLGSAQLAASETGGGTYIYEPSNGSWTKIDGGVYSLMAAGDFYGTSEGNNSNTDLAAYDPGVGTYLWQSGYGWTKIDNGTVTALAAGDFNGGTTAGVVASESGAGTYLWAYGVGWTKIDGGVYSMMAAGDFYGTSNGNAGNTDLAAYDPGVGTYIWSANAGWTKIDTGNATEYAAGNFLGTSNGNNNNADLAVYFPGSGTYIWSATGSWIKIDSGTATGLAAVDLNGNGQNELLAYFPNAGMYEWQSGVGWSKYDATSTLPATTQSPLFAEGNFQGGAVVDAAVGFTSTAGIWLDPPGVSSASAVPAPVTVGNGASVDLNTPSAAAVTFAGGSGTLQLDQSAAFSGTITGFGGQDQLDLTDIAFSANSTLGYSANSNNSGGGLTVSDGIHMANIALLGSYMASSFVTSSDGHGGTLISEAAQISSQATLLAQPHAPG